MFSKYYPNCYVESVFLLDYQKIYDLGFRLVIFDIDNTLAHHGENPSEEIENLFKEIHKIGLKTLLFSDNSNERINQFCKNIDSLFVAEANKPNTQKLFKALEDFNLPKEKSIYIGDQIFRDICMTNQAGIKSILVKYLRKPNQKKGIRRRLEKFILWFYLRSKKYQSLKNIFKEVQNNRKRRKLFCEIHPIFFKISEIKEQLKYNLKDIYKKNKFAKEISKEKMENLISEYTIKIIKSDNGINPQTQENKKVNIIIACKKLNGLIIKPGETFSFWKILGKVSESKGFKAGRILRNNKLITWVGWGLCNLANSIHNVILLSPLQITQFHSHSDALSPDQEVRKPFSSGTSVSYNYIDYRFKNNTNSTFQLLACVEDDMLQIQLKSNNQCSSNFKLSEENHHFKQKDGKYYRISKIYVETSDKKTGKILNKKLVLDNHSEVMFDYQLIPKEQIRE